MHGMLVLVQCITCSRCPEDPQPLGVVPMTGCGLEEHIQKMWIAVFVISCMAGCTDWQVVHKIGVPR